MRQVMLDSALNPDSRSPSPQPLPHVEEQRALRSETIAAFHGAVVGGVDEDDDGDNVDGGDGDEDDGFLVPREKSKDEILQEEEEYRAFLEREVGDDLADLVTVEEGGGVFVAGDEEEEEEETNEKRKKKRRKKEKESGEAKKQKDQEFLVKFVFSIFSYPLK
jgi:protein KRI1